MLIGLTEEQVEDLAIAARDGFFCIPDVDGVMPQKLIVDGAPTLNQKSRWRWTAMNVLKEYHKMLDKVERVEA